MKKIIVLMTIVFLIFPVACKKADNGSETSPNTFENTTQTSAASTTTTVLETTFETSIPSTDKPDITTQSENTTESTTTSATYDPSLLDYFIMPDDSRRPVAIMIDNEGFKSYPQGGLYKAQIVYEMIAEWGETRFMPIFYSFESGNVGPVRSIRHYFIQFAMEYDPILVHIGYSPLGQRMIENNNLASLNGLNPKNYSIYFDITKDKNNWQDTYTNFEYIKNHIKKLGFREEPSKTFPFQYGETDLNGKSARNVYLEYSKWYNVGFKYDENSKLYARYRNGEYHIDRNTGNILAAKNIIIQKVNAYPIKNDNAGRMTMDNVGTGTGYFVTNGQSREIIWEKKSEFAQTSYIYTDNSEKITLNKGQTWIMIIDESSKYVID